VHTSAKPWEGMYLLWTATVLGQAAATRLHAATHLDRKSHCKRLFSSICLQCGRVGHSSCMCSLHCCQWSRYPAVRTAYVTAAWCSLSSRCSTSCFSRNMGAIGTHRLCSILDAIATQCMLGFGAGCRLPGSEYCSWAVKGGASTWNAMLRAAPHRNKNSKAS